MLSRAAALVAAFLTMSLALFASSTTPVSRPHIELSVQQDLQISSSLTRASQFADVPHLSQDESCEQVEQPVALATPDPLSVSTGRGKKVAVSFIIGTDGHVHSPLILESAGVSGDRRVLQTVRSWRYRPGTCNGVPTETEGKIEFSIQ